MLVFMSVLQLKGPNLTPFSAEKENLILGLWQLQQAGQDFRIKQVCFVMLIAAGRSSRACFCSICSVKSNLVRVLSCLVMLTANC